MATHCSILAWRIPMGRGAWQATVHGFAKSRIQLSDQAQQHTLLKLLYFSLLFILEIKCAWKSNYVKYKERNWKFYVISCSGAILLKMWLTGLGWSISDCFVTSLQGNRKQKLLVAILCFNYILQNVDSHGIKMIIIIIIIIIITLKNFFTTDWLKSTGLKRHCFQYICYYVYIILNLVVKFLYIYLVNKYMYVKKFGQCIWTGRYK